MTAVVSGEGVAVDLAHAGVGSRLVAAGIDLAVQFVAVVVLILLDSALALNTDASAVAALVIVELVLVFAGYPIGMEWLCRGRTLGKLAMGLRVVRDDGGPIGFRQALVRGLAGLILEKPGLFFPLGAAAGVIVMGSSPSSKRIGDYLAGTFVLAERAGPRSALVAPTFAVPYFLQGWAVALDLSRLDDQLALGVRQFLLRAHQLTPVARDQLGAQLRARVLAVVAPQPPPGTPDPAVLSTVLAERRRRSETTPRAAFLPPGYQQVSGPAPGHLPPMPVTSTTQPAVESPFAPPS